MQQKVVPLLVPPLRKSQPGGMGSLVTKKRGMAVLTTPLLNKGSAFTVEERQSLGLTGLLPPVISTLQSQVASAYLQYQRLPDALGKNIYLTALHDRNEVLFFRLLSEHLREMIPIVNDRTVGLAIKQYHHECRRPRGVYLSINDPEGIEVAFRNLGLGPDDIDLWEVNEAFAVVLEKFIRDLRLDRDKVNVNGGAIALGHPIGASGARVLVTLLYEMARRDAKKGLASLCIGGGMGVALAVER